LIAARVGVYEGEESRFAQGGNPMKRTFEQISHHDELITSIDGVNPNVLPDMATEPLFIAMRYAMPRTQTFSPIYRTPVVINTRTGDFVSGSLRSRRRRED